MRHLGAGAGTEHRGWLIKDWLVTGLGMGILALAADERVTSVAVTDDELSVRLMDGRTISVPLAWYPLLLQATEIQRHNWRIGGGGYGIHW